MAQLRSVSHFIRQLPCKYCVFSYQVIFTRLGFTQFGFGKKPHLLLFSPKSADDLEFISDEKSVPQKNISKKNEKSIEKKIQLERLEELEIRLRLQVTVVRQAIDITRLYAAPSEKCLELISALQRQNEIIHAELDALVGSPRESPRCVCKFVNVRHSPAVENRNMHKIPPQGLGMDAFFDKPPRLRPFMGSYDPRTAMLFIQEFENRYENVFKEYPDEKDETAKALYFRLFINQSICDWIDTMDDEATYEELRRKLLDEYWKMEVAPHILRQFWKAELKSDDDPVEFVQLWFGKGMETDVLTEEDMLEHFKNTFPNLLVSSLPEGAFNSLQSLIKSLTVWKKTRKASQPASKSN